MKIKPSSSPPSPSPIAAFAQRRSSFAQLREVSAFHELGRPYSEHPHSFGPSPSALVGQLRSSPEPTRTAFERRFLSYMPCRKLRAQRRFGEVRWLDDPAPSSTTEPLPLDWTLSSPSVADCIRHPGGFRLRPVMASRLVRTESRKPTAAHVPWKHRGQQCRELLC
jgi:hypothetical protein